MEGSPDSRGKRDGTRGETHDQEYQSTGDSDISGMINVNGILFFIATDGVNEHGFHYGRALLFPREL